jgi:hypothetical protein
MAPINPLAIIPMISSEITVKMSKLDSIATEIVIRAKTAQKRIPKPSSACLVVGSKPSASTRVGGVRARCGASRRA